MRLKSRTWFVISLLLFGAGALVWHHAEKVRLSGHSGGGAKPLPALNAPLIKAAGTNAVAGRKSYRLSNTSQNLAQLLHNNHAIILRNALIDTRRPLRLDIPAQLRAKEAPGSYIVQFDRPLNREFYDSVKKDGGVYVSYIPNNAALVKADAAQAQQLAADPVFQAVLPYEPYYKLDGTLLPGAVEGQGQTNLLSVTTFPGQRDAAMKALSDLGAQLVGQDQGPFGPTLVVRAPPESVAAIAQLPLAQEVEAYEQRRLLNDLTRVQLGVSVNTLTNTPNYLNLSGSNVIVNLNDTGVDSTHLDFTGEGASIRLLGSAAALQDGNGHGTHVAGIIAGNGRDSDTVTNPVPGSIIPGADFRGKATNATLFVQGLDLVFGPFVSDAQLQVSASTNLGPTNLISNNSWGYGGNSYDIHSASYDAATRDAQPAVKGEQPLLFVFAAGDGGNGDDSGVLGNANTINSPATAKNVITVGATDAPRFITNEVSYDGHTTNEVFLGGTDNSNLVAYFSGCGNVDVGVEGNFGRFKPDVVAPGVFIVSCRANNYGFATNEVTVTEISVTNQTVLPNQTNYYPILIPSDASELVVQVLTNSGSPLGFTNGFVVVADTNSPPTVIQSTNALGPNVVALTNQLTPGTWYVGIAPPARDVQPLAYDINLYVYETNGLGDYFTVVSNMNNALAPNYLYLSGTSMSAGAVSGVLALMQEFLQSTLKMTPSPALLKALLINGSRSLGLQYDFNVQTLGANEQGWGMPNIANSIPYSLTNQSGPSVVFFDQSPTNNALATGQSQTYMVSDPSGTASNSPVRITLVWTDPPGDPAAGVALVNQLDLTVVDASGTNVYIGNDFFSGDIFSEVNTGDAPDSINNVQNVYIDNAYTPIVFPLTVTVSGARVNVNAVTTQTNMIAQDYALVISSDNPLAPLTVQSNAIFTPAPIPLVTEVVSGMPLLHQRVGANEPDFYDFALGKTNGNLSQWHFFEFSNIALETNGAFTNVAFATFLPPDLSVPRTTGADIDMYVSTNSALTNLDANAVYYSYKSLSREGTETFVTNMLGVTNWYIGIKSEDQQAADFGFYAVAQTNQFSTVNPNGSVTATGTAVPVNIPDAAAGAPAYVFAFLLDPVNPVMQVQDVTVTLSIPHGNPSDLYGTLTHNGVNVVLNHYSGPPGGITTTYDDLGENPGAGDSHSDGPGSLINYIGQPGQGLWMLTEADDALSQGGQIQTFSITATPQPLGLGFTVTIPPDSWYKDYIAVPNDATNLTIYVTYASEAGGPVDIFLTNFDDVNFGDYGVSNIFAPGGSLSLSNKPPPPPPDPPLSGGTWYYGLYNDNNTESVTLNVLIQIKESLTPNLVETFSNNIVTPLTTDATTQSQICITSGQQVVDLSVGVRIADTNLDDLVLHLTSPQGTSVLLFENRGGTTVSNLGLGLPSTSNLVYTVFTEDTNLTTTPIKFAPVFATDNAVTNNTIIASDGFETVAAATYTNGQTLGAGWTVATNQVGVVADPNLAHSGNNFLALTTGRITNTFTTIPGARYELQYYARSPQITDWWPADDNTADIVGANNGTIPNHDVTYDVGEVDRAFTFSGVPGDPAYTGDEVDFGTNVSNFRTNDFTVDFWIKMPTNVADQVAILEKRPECDDNLSAWDIKCGDVRYAAVSSPGRLFLEAASDGALNVGLWVSSIPLNDDIFHHVALTRSGTNNLFYIDGAADTGMYASGNGIADIFNDAMFRAGNSVCVCPGVINCDSTQPFTGDMDELDLWHRALSPAEIYAIYAAGSLGKYSTNSLLPNFAISIDGYSTNTVILPSFAGGWQSFTNSFIATNSQVTIELAGNTLSTLFDDVQLIQLPSTNYNNYFLPEQPLTPFLGEDPQGCWTLDVWDTRLDSPLPDNGVLLSWDLQMTISSTNVNLIVLKNGVAYPKGRVGGNSITYFAVDVPLTANFATNTLSGASEPLNLLFNQTALPTGALPGDVNLLKHVQSGVRTLDSQGAPPPLVPGKRYYLGVQNNTPEPAIFSLEVQFDVGNNSGITALTNEVYFKTKISTNGPEFYSFTSPSNAKMVTFQVLNPTNAELDLYARAGLPVPGPMSFDYESRNAGTNDQFIVITTNSLPLALVTATTNTAQPLLPTTWYLAVYNFSGVSNAGYTIVATYSTNIVANSLTAGAIDVVTLKDGVIKYASAVPGYPTNFLFSFDVAGSPAGVQFDVNNISGAGNLELLADIGAFPTPEQSYSASFNPGTAQQLIIIGTNDALPSLNGIWYLAVPNTSSIDPVAYSIIASTTNNPPAQNQPFSIGARISSPNSGFSLYWSAVPGQNYTVEVSTNLTSWTVVTNIIAQSNTATYTESVPADTQPARFFRLTTQ
jgi:subtilisin-like proprotein convertase family protein